MKASDLSYYVLPEGNVQISFSGGRTSGHMLHQILLANGGIDTSRVVVSFQNTGRESPYTLDFISEVSFRWEVPIIWLEYIPTKPFFDVVGHNSASRSGEPFEALIRKKGGYLPNQQQRFCTQELKVLCAKRYLVSIGWKKWTAATGIRADERHRLKKPDKDRWVSWRPSALAGVTKRDVEAFWKSHPFDLKLPIVKGKTIGGNCVDCFLKSEAEIAAHMRDHPEDDWSERMEKLGTELTGSTSEAFFSKRFRRRDLRRFVERQGDWIFSDKSFLCQKDDGECTE